MISLEILIPARDKRLYIKIDESEKVNNFFEIVKEVIGEEMNELEWEMIATNSFRRIEGNDSLCEAGITNAETILFLKRAV